MLKLLIILNVALAIINLFFLLRSSSEPEGRGQDRGRKSAVTEIAPDTPAAAAGTRPSGGGLGSQLGGGSREASSKQAPPVAAEKGESWYLPENHLVIGLQGSVRSKHPPRLEKQIIGDLELDADQSASMNEALGVAAAALIDCERERRMVLTDDDGKRFVYVAEYKEEARQIFADLQAALASASDPDSAAILMIGIKNSVYFRKRGEEAKLTLGVRYDGKPAIEDWRGDWVHRWGGFGKIDGIVRLPFEGSCDHLLDFKELGWSAD